MTDHLDQNKTFSRRVALLLGGKAVLLSSIAWRMYDLQVREGKRYALLADENRINTRLLLPPRGRILDRFGTPLATNREDYRVAIVAEHRHLSLLHVHRAHLASALKDAGRGVSIPRSQRLMVP